MFCRMTAVRPMCRYLLCFLHTHWFLAKVRRKEIQQLRLLFLSFLHCYSVLFIPPFYFSKNETEVAGGGGVLFLTWQKNCTAEINKELFQNLTNLFALTDTKCLWCQLISKHYRCRGEVEIALYKIMPCQWITQSCFQSPTYLLSSIVVKKWKVYSNAKQGKM